MKTSGISIASLPRKYQNQVAPQIYPQMMAGRVGASKEPQSLTRQHFVVMIEPMGKPRMTQQDKWRKRDCVVRYRAYADQLRAGCPDRFPDPLRVSFVAYFSIPESWSAKKKAAMAGQPHRQKCDADNAMKGIFDSLWEHDEIIASGSFAKLWDDGRGARIELTIER